MNISTPNIPGLTSTQLQTNLEEIRETGIKDLTKALTDLGVVNATGSTMGQDGMIQLTPPKATMNVMDLTLRIGLLQDALNQLQQQTSKNEIQGRLNDMNRENADKLSKIKEQVEHAAEQLKKMKESQAKANMFGFLGAIFKAILDFFMAIFNVIAAVGYALTGNVAAAAGLMVSAGALVASGIVHLVEAADSLGKLAFGKGFLSEADKQRMSQAVEILGYIAMGAAMIGGLGAIVDGISQAGALATKELTKLAVQEMSQQVVKIGTEEVAEQSVKQMVKQIVKEVLMDALQESGKLATKFSTTAQETMSLAMKEALKEGSTQATKQMAKEAIKAAVKEVMINAFKDFMQAATKTALANAIVGGSSQIIGGVGDLVVSDIRSDAAAEKLLADQAEAKAKAIEAMIQMLHKMIEQLQQQLSDMLDSAMQAVSAIFDAADDSASSMKELMHFQAA